MSELAKVAHLPPPIDCFLQSKKKTAASEAAEGATKRKSKSKAPVEVVPDATFDAFTSSAPAADDDLFGDSAFGDFSAAAPDPFAAAPSDPFASDGGGFGDFSAPAGGDPFNAAPAAKSNDAFATDDLFSALPASSSSAIPDPFGGDSALWCPGSFLIACLPQAHLHSSRARISTIFSAVAALLRWACTAHLRHAARRTYTRTGAWSGLTLMYRLGSGAATAVCGRCGRCLQGSWGNPCRATPPSIAA